MHRFAGRTHSFVGTDSRGRGKRDLFGLILGFLVLLSPHVCLAQALDAVDPAGRREQLGFQLESRGGAYAQGDSCDCVDLVFVIDDTGSMVASIESVAEGIADILSVAESTCGGDVKAGLVTFKDEIEVDVPLTLDLVAVETGIDAIAASGGRGVPEASDEALREVLTATECSLVGGFDPGAFRAECCKVAILVTDAPPGGCDDSFTSGIDDVNAHQRALDAAVAGVAIGAVQVGTHPHARPIMLDYAATSGGVFAEVGRNGSGTAAAIEQVLLHCLVTEDVERCCIRGATIDEDLCVDVPLGICSELGGDVVSDCSTCGPQPCNDADVNGDGRVASDDREAIVRCIAGTPPTGGTIEDCDINKDGCINHLDVQAWECRVNGGAAEECCEPCTPCGNQDCDISLSDLGICRQCLTDCDGFCSPNTCADPLCPCDSTGDGEFTMDDINVFRCLFLGGGRECCESDALEDIIIIHRPTPDCVNCSPIAIDLRAAIVVGDSDIDVDPDSSRVIYATNRGPAMTTPMMLEPDDSYRGTIPAQPAGTLVEYSLEFQDTDGNTYTEPAGGQKHSFVLGNLIVVEQWDMETASGWTAGDASMPDDATGGSWERGIPQGLIVTVDGNDLLLTPDADTSESGQFCWLTQLDTGVLGADDVDGGKTTLVSPVFDLSSEQYVRVRYNQWFTNAFWDNPDEDPFEVAISSDGGATYTVLEEQSLGTAPFWEQKEIVLNGLINFTDQMRLRFVVKDLGGDSFVEAAIDDVTIVRWDPLPVGVSDAADAPRARAWLGHARPNPLNPSTVVDFAIPNDALVQLRVYDLAGRLVQTLIDAPLAAGTHRATWDGSSADGAPAVSGVYVYRLDDGTSVLTRKMVLLK